MISRNFVERYNEALESKDKERQAVLLTEFEERLDSLLKMHSLPRLPDYFLCLRALPFLIERFALKIIKLNTKLLTEKEVPVRDIYQVMGSSTMNNWLANNLDNREVYDIFLAFALKAAENEKMYCLILEWWKRSNDSSGVKHFPRQWEIHLAISNRLKKLYGDYKIKKKGFNFDDTVDRIIYSVYIDKAEEYINIHLLPMVADSEL